MNNKNHCMHMVSYYSEVLKNARLGKLHPINVFWQFYAVKCGLLTRRI